MYEVGDLCTSVCSNCGTICEAFPITDLASAMLYSTKKCTTVIGDLYIMGLPVTVTKKVLFDNLNTIQYIRGDLYMKDNAYMPAMTFFSGLLGVYGIHYENNIILSDARMPSLIQLRGPVTVDGCDRLCPSRYTSLNSAADDPSCTNALVDVYLYLSGNFKMSDLPLIGMTLSSIVQNVTNHGVCIILLFSSLLFLILRL